MKHAHYRALCCLALKDSQGREIYHVALGRLMIRVSLNRLKKFGRRRSSFYRANALELGLFTFYWRDRKKV